MISGHGTIEMAVTANPAWRLRLSGKAVPIRSPAAAGAARAGGGAAGAGECGAAPARGRRDRADRRQQRHQRRARRDRAGGANRLARADPRPGRVRQRGGGAHGACPVPPGRRAVRRAELRHLEPGAFRGELFGGRGRQRPRRHPPAAPGCWSAPWRNLAAGRSVRHAAGDAGQDRARAAGPDVRAAGRLDPREGGRAGAGDYQQGSAGRRFPPGGSGRICITAWPWSR